MGNGDTAKDHRRLSVLDVIGVGCIVLAQILFLVGSVALFLHAGTADIIVAAAMAVLSLSVLFLLWKTCEENWGQRR